MSLTFTSLTPAVKSTKSLETAILETLAYSDIFDYPLTVDELHKYLVIRVTRDEIKNCISDIKIINSKDNFYFLQNRSEIVDIRKARVIKSNKIFKRAMFYGKILGMLPFVRMSAITGSLAMLNLSLEIDMDFMLITQPKRLWLARAFAVSFGRVMRLIGDRICVNVLLSQNQLLWHEQDLYSAREICQMIPVSGFDPYKDFRVANLWAESILPNATIDIKSNSKLEIKTIFQKLFELLFFSKLGDMLEKWVMNIQLKIISKNAGVSDETKFSEDICQGNFHQHKKWTLQEYKKRINEINQL